MRSLTLRGRVPRRRVEHAPHTYTAPRLHKDLIHDRTPPRAIELVEQPQSVGLAAYRIPKRFELIPLVRSAYLCSYANADGLLQRSIHWTRLISRSQQFHFVDVVQSRNYLAVMPPKQATLGYVKSSQQTLGCMSPWETLQAVCLSTILYRKFFGQQQNGPKPKPQQSTLAFNPPRPAKSVDAQKEDDKALRISKRTNSKYSEDSDLNGATETDSNPETNLNLTNGCKAEPDAETTLDTTNEVDDCMDTNEMSVESEPAEDTQNLASEPHPKSSPKRSNSDIKDEEDEDEEPVKKRPRRREPEYKPKQPSKKVDAAKSARAAQTKSDGSPREIKSEAKSLNTSHKASRQLPNSTASTGSRSPEDVDNDINVSSEVTKGIQTVDESTLKHDASDVDEEEVESDEDDEKPEVAAKAREKVQSTLKSNGKDPYPDWPLGDPVPYAALCTTFSLVEMTTKRLIISAHCSLFLRQVLRLTPQDLLPTVQLTINKLAADYAGIELGIGESLIMKAIGESTGRSLQIIKADQNEIGDLGLVAAKSRSNQPTMFKPKSLTVRGVLEGLMNIAIVQGDGSQGRKVAGIKKLLSAADAAMAGKGGKGIDITKDKGGASEAKFIIRFLEGKLRLGLAERTVLVALAHAMVIHETEKKGSKLPSSDQLASGESILKTVYR